ncbi:MAG: exosortase/archaeosortase family protein [Syntrophorhabdus sp.]
MATSSKLITNSVLLFLIGSILTVMYYGTFTVLIGQWNTMPEYSHGYLIPAISLYMVWHVNNEKPLTIVDQSHWNSIPLIIGLLLLVVSKVGSEHFLQGVSMIVVLWGLCLYIGGSSIARRLALPIGFLIFMIPLPGIVWNNFSLFLKLQVTNIAAYFLGQMTNIAFIQDGNIITLAAGSLEVADACSGVRSLISMLALGVLVVFMSKYAAWKKLILLMSTIPIAVLANIVRLILLVILAEYYGIKVADGYLHVFSGLLVFSIGLILLMGVHVLLSSSEDLKTQYL